MNFENFPLRKCTFKKKRSIDSSNACAHFALVCWPVRLGLSHASVSIAIRWPEQLVLVLAEDGGPHLLPRTDFDLDLWRKIPRACDVFSELRNMNLRSGIHPLILHDQLTRHFIVIHNHVEGGRTDESI